MKLEEIARLRQTAYRLLSAVFLYPDQGRVASIARAARELAPLSHGAASLPFFPEWSRLLRTAGGGATSRALEEEYQRIFQSAPGETACLPYESAQSSGGAAFTGWLLALLEREYASAGLAVDPAPAYPPDHVSVEMEFMAFLCGSEANAWSMRDPLSARRWLERQEVFLGRHVGRWVPRWAGQAAALAGCGYFGAAAEAARALAGHDPNLVRALVERLEAMGPSHGGPPSAAPGAVREAHAPLEGEAPGG